MPRSGFAGAVTGTPFASSRSITPFQLDRVGERAVHQDDGRGWLLGHDAPFRSSRSDLNAARISVAKSSGSSQAAKWPPLSTSLK